MQTGSFIRGPEGPRGPTGRAGRFRADCGPVRGVVEHADHETYTVRRTDGPPSDRHEDGLYRFTQDRFMGWED
jgi:hypothetical protein